MIPSSPLSLRFHFKAAGLFLLVTIGVFSLASYFDKAAFLGLEKVDVASSDWNRMFRVFGFLPFWLLAALALAFCDCALVRVQGWALAMSRAALLAMSVFFSGAMAEILKLVIRRERPRINGGDWGYRSFFDGPWDSTGLGMPSSHAVVGFAAAWMLCRIFPRASLVWIAMAVGCAVTRVLNHSHFISDTVISAAVAFAIVRALWFWHQYNQLPGQAKIEP